MYSTIEDIDSLVQQFEEGTIPQAAWTHQAHLCVGLFHVLHYGREESIIRLRSRIILMNKIHDVPNSATRGYHETITLFWIWVLQEYIQRYDFSHSIEKYHEFLNSKFQRADLLFEFYTRERLFSVEARAVWVDPDLKKLDFNSMD